MKNVILARDRKKRTLNQRIVFLVIFILLWSAVLFLLLPEDNANKPVLALDTDYEQSQQYNNESRYQPIQSEANIAEPVSVGKTELESTASTSESATSGEAIATDNIDSVNIESAVSQSTDTPTATAPANEDDPNATSYDDELSHQDDEVEQGSINTDPNAQNTEFLPQEAQNALEILLDAADEAWRIHNQFSETVVGGQQLNDILDQSGLELSVATELIAAFPELKNLKAGQQFYWILNKDDQLQYMNWLVSDKEERIYERQIKGHYTQQVLKKKSVWKTEVIKGQIQSSFSNSLSAHGISARQINQLATALQWQVSMRSLHKGDKFAILMEREYLGDKLTGQARVDAIHILHAGKGYYAIQAANGAYYNVNGETLGRGFARYPLTRQPKISSHFNLSRRHPITKRISPHKGVDFSIPIGTRIIAPSDGEVVKVAYQANGAGRYIVLQHGRKYKTVYMHLSKALVKPGQKVKRGERIALSGNTGRSTGPHLHYEFHINDRPVNPMKVKLPGSNTGLPAKDRKAFLVKSKEIVNKLKL